MKTYSIADLKTLPLCVRCTSDLQAARIYKACGRNERKFLSIKLKEVFVFLGENAFDGNVGYALTNCCVRLNFTELDSIAFEQISDFHEKKKINVQELGRAAWGKINTQFINSGGVNPHAYMLGFEEGFKQAISSANRLLGNNS